MDPFEQARNIAALTLAIGTGGHIAPKQLEPPAPAPTPIAQAATPVPDSQPKPTIWTAEYVREHKMETDAHVEDKIKDGSYVSLSDYLASLPAKMGNTPECQQIVENGTHFIHEFSDMSHRLGVSPVPPIYVDMKNDSGEFFAQASQTVEGKKMIKMNTNFVKEIGVNHDGALDIAGHELTHFRLKSTSAKAIAHEHNDPQYNSKLEGQCDLIGAGPLGGNNPKALADIFTSMRIQREVQYMNINNIPPPDPDDDQGKAALRVAARQWELKQFPSHPPFGDRADALYKEAAEIEASPPIIPNTPGKSGGRGH